MAFKYHMSHGHLQMLNSNTTKHHWKRLHYYGNVVIIIITSLTENLSIMQIIDPYWNCLLEPNPPACIEK